MGRWLVAYVRVEGLLCCPEAGRPVVVAAAGRVLDVSRAAALAGVRPGQRLRTARLACPGAEVRARDPEGERARRESFLSLLAGCAPRVEPDGPRAAFAAFDVGERRGEEEALAALEGLVARLVPHHGHRVDVGVAPSRVVARIAADLLDSPSAACVEPRPRVVALPGGEARWLVVREGQVRRFLEPLATARLWPLPAAVREQLWRLGLHRVGDLARTPPSALRAALPAEVAERVVRLARGEDDRPVQAAYPPPALRASWRFPEPLADAQAWRAAADALADRLAARLRRQGRAARELWLWLETAAGRIPRVRPCTRPLVDAVALRHAARGLLEREPPPAPLEGLVLEARALVPAPAVQATLWDLPAVRTPAAAAGGAATVLGCLPAALAARVRRGSELDVPRRERLRAYWDPLTGGAWGPRGGEAAPGTLPRGGAPLP